VSNSIRGKCVTGVAKGFATYQYPFRSMVEGVIIDEFLDFPGEAKQCRVHDVRQVSGKCLDIIARLRGRSC
jgi:hypothetical protein